jgi:hypothetical protein
MAGRCIEGDILKTPPRIGTKNLPAHRALRAVNKIQVSHRLTQMNTDYSAAQKTQLAQREKGMEGL